MNSTVRNIVGAGLVYLWFVMVMAIAKLATPLFNTSSWFQVLVVDPLAATLVFYLYQHLVRRIRPRAKRHNI